MPARALCATERERVLDVLSSPRFVDRSPGEVMATFLDDGVYLCSPEPVNDFETPSITIY